MGVYVLAKKLKPSVAMIRNHEKKLDALYEMVTLLGYEKDIVQDLNQILKSHRFHPVYRNKMYENEEIILAKKVGTWKPVFNLTGKTHYKSNFSEIEKLCIDLQETHDIFHILQDGQRFQLTLDELKEQTLYATWEGFGMGKKWNQEEDTLWDYIYDSTKFAIVF